MKIAIISDIHSNLEALEAVEQDVCNQKVDVIHCLGDIVGYGPFPAECLSLVRSLCKEILKGNHEDSVCDPKKGEEELNDHALEAINFSREKLEKKTIDFLSQLKEKVVLENLEMTLCHGAFTEPSVWKYIDSESLAEKELAKTPTKICVIGHTHNPFVFDSEAGLHEYLPDNLELDLDQKYLINVGSVGQPRDGDCRASYGIFEIKEDKVIFSLQRVFYDISETEKFMKKFKLPPFLSERLFRGD